MDWIDLLCHLFKIFYETRILEMKVRDASNSVVTCIFLNYIFEFT